MNNTLDLNQILDKLLVNSAQIPVYARNAAIIIMRMTPVYKLYNIDNSLNQIDNMVDQTRMHGAVAIGMLVSELTAGNEPNEHGRRRSRGLSFLTTMFALSATLAAGFQEDSLLNQRHKLLNERNAVLNMANNAPAPQI